jgi:hypothetical protein
LLLAWLLHSAVQGLDESLICWGCVATGHIEATWKHRFLFVKNFTIMMMMEAVPVGLGPVSFGSASQ